MFKLLVLVCIFVCAAEACHELWYNHCTSNADCCSGNCFKGDDGSWREGLCKPGDQAGPPGPPGPPPQGGSSSGCHQLWYNQCTDNSQCCSGNCFKGDDGGWKEGVCKP